MSHWPLIVWILFGLHVRLSLLLNAYILSGILLGLGGLEPRKSLSVLNDYFHIKCTTHHLIRCPSQPRTHTLTTCHLHTHTNFYTHKHAHTPDSDNQCATTDLQSVEVMAKWQLSQSAHSPPTLQGIKDKQTCSDWMRNRNCVWMWILLWPCRVKVKVGKCHYSPVWRE